MTTNVDAPRPAQRPSEVGSQLLRFAAVDQVPLAALSASTPYFDDLLSAFPAVSVALARRRGPPAARRKALALVRSGAPLAQIASVLGLPMWLKSVPPEFLHFSLPEAFADTPADAKFGRRVANAMPIEIEPGGRWLDTVLHARAVGGDLFAIWLALCLRGQRADISPRAFELLAAFAFMSRRPDADPALFERAWHPKMGFTVALTCANEWLVRLFMRFQAAHRRTIARWTPTRRFRGLEFVLLETREDLVEEGQAMKNCAAVYTDRVALGVSQLFSIRRDGERVATMELSPGAADHERTAVLQIEGPRRADAPAEVSRSACAWVRRAGRSSSLPQTRAEAVRLGAEAWRRYWRPYWDAFGAVDFIPPDPPARAVDDYLVTLRRCVFIPRTRREQIVAAMLEVRALRSARRRRPPRHPDGA